jgi:hypothetical protein
MSSSFKDGKINPRCKYNESNFNCVQIRLEMLRTNKQVANVAMWLLSLIFEAVYNVTTQ